MKIRADWSRWESRKYHCSIGRNGVLCWINIVRLTGCMISNNPVNYPRHTYPDSNHSGWDLVYPWGFQYIRFTKNKISIKIWKYVLPQQNMKVCYFEKNFVVSKHIWISDGPGRQWAFIRRPTQYKVRMVNRKCSCKCGQVEQNVPITDNCMRKTAPPPIKWTGNGYVGNGGHCTEDIRHDSVSRRRQRVLYRISGRYILLIRLTFLKPSSNDHESIAYE